MRKKIKKVVKSAMCGILAATMVFSGCPIGIISGSNHKKYVDVYGYGDEEYDYDNSETITIADGVKELEYGVFESNDNIKIIKLPKSVEKISESAFTSFEKLEKIEVDENNSYYESYEGILYSKEDTELVICPYAMKELVFKPDVLTIGSFAFMYCNNLTEIVIPYGVKNIKSEAFVLCQNLDRLLIPKTVTSFNVHDMFYDYTDIYPNVFYYDMLEDDTITIVSCYVGKSVVEIPDSVTSIGDSVFYGCSNLTEIEIPSSVTSIGDSAFSGCSSLTSIEIPSGVTTIGDFAFFGCRSLTSIEIPSGVTNIGEGAFEDCTELNKITIPDSVTTIGENAFRNCKSVEEFVIPKEAKQVGASAFAGINKNASIFLLCDSSALDENALAYDEEGSANGNFTIYYTEDGNYDSLITKYNHYTWKKIKQNQEPVVMKLTTDVSSVKAGDKLTATVSVDKNPGVAGLGARISYDKNVLRLNSVSEPLTSSYANTVLFPVQSLLNNKSTSIATASNGTIGFAGSNATAVFEEGPVMIAEFEVLSYATAGESVLSFAYTDASDAEADFVPVEVSEVKFKVKPSVHINADEEQKEDMQAAKEVAELVQTMIDDEETQVKGMDEELASDLMEAVINGYWITTELKKTQLEENQITENDIKAVKETISEAENIAGYFDVKLLVEINYDQSGTIDELNHEIEVSLDIPTDLQKVEEGKFRSYRVYRLFNGKAEEVSSVASGDTITFKTNTFDQYIITYEDNAGMKGDSNGDGEVDIADALMISRFDAGLVELDDAVIKISDVNGDGEVDIADALMISRFDAGLIVSFNPNAAGNSDESDSVIENKAVTNLASSEVTFHFYNASNWKNVGAWICEDTYWESNVLPRDKCILNDSGNPIWPGAKMEAEGGNWYKITCTYSNLSNGSIMMFNNYVGDSKSGDFTSDADIQKLRAAGITLNDTDEKIQTPYIMIRKNTTLASSDYYINWDGDTRASMIVFGKSDMFTDVPPAEYINRNNSKDVSLCDVNADGAVNTEDAVLMEQYSNDQIQFSDEMFAAADVDNSGEVNKTDIMYILKYIAGYYNNLIYFS